MKKGLANFAVVVSILILGHLGFGATTKKTFDVGNQNVTASVETFKPPIAVHAKSAPTNSVAQTYLNYQLRLSEGKIKKAAELTAAPEATVKQQTAYMNRLGGQNAYSKKMNEVFDAKLTLTHVLELGSAKMLLGNHPKHGPFATFFNCAKQPCLITDDLKDPDVEKLGLILNAVRDKKITL